MTPSASDSPSSPSTETLTVEACLERLSATLHERHATVCDALQSDGLEPLRNALDEARRAHEKARTALETDDSPTRRELWTAIRSYRQDVMVSVWQPLRSTLDDLALGALLHEQRQFLAQTRDSLDEMMPATVLRPEPTGLYAPVDGEGWGQRGAKALVRGWRTIIERVWGAAARQQTVPLATLVGHHAATTLADAHEAALDTAEQRLVQWVARLEREATAWTHRLLEVERVLDRPDFHVPEIEDALPEPSADPTEGVVAADVEALHKEGREQAASLQACLDDGCALTLDDVAKRLDDSAKCTVDRVADAAGRAGSLFAERVAQPQTRSKAEETERWSDWFGEVTHRLAFLDALATLRDDLTARHAALVSDVVAAGLDPARAAEQETAERLRALRDEIDTLLAPPAPGGELDLVQSFDHKVETGTDVLEQLLLTPLRDWTPRRAVETVVETHRSAVTALLEEQPEGFVVHPLVAPDADRVSPSDEAYTLQWRNGGEEVLDEVLFDGWRTALGPLVTASDAVRECATEVRGVVQFNLGAALQELQDLRDARKHERPDASFVDDARELALGGLDRALDLLSGEEKLNQAAGRATHDLWTATTKVWTELHDRMRAVGETRAHVLRLRGTLVRGTRWLSTEAGRRLRGITTQVQRTAHRMQRQARRLVRLGHAAVGTEPVDEAALRQTVDVLSTVDALLADLPLVYRRLFSFRPIQDPDLLVARESDQTVVEEHRARWLRGLTDAIVLTGPVGSGRTSLLNVLRKTTFRTAQRHHIELSERLTTEAAFAEQVVQALNLSLDPGDGLTLDAVAEHLNAQPVPDRIRVCTIEQFEHVVRRTVGGTQLAARILGFLSETDTRILWVVTTTNATWQLIEASEPAAARLVTRHVLDPFDRAEMEEMIMRRHRRSGLGLAFEPPDGTTHPILARRLRTIDDEERRQALLRSEFFDTLYEASGQNVMLALFYWFRAVTFEADNATLRVQPLDPIAFGALDALPLPHAFAMKALLEHGTLTAGELAEVLGVSVTTSRSLLETLGNALVVAPAEESEGPGGFRFVSVDYDTRYRVRPLVIHPVTRFLRSRNILH